MRPHLETSTYSLRPLSHCFFLSTYWLQAIGYNGLAQAVSRYCFASLYMPLDVWLITKLKLGTPRYCTHGPQDRLLRAATNCFPDPTPPRYAQPWLGNTMNGTYKHLLLVLASSQSLRWRYRPNRLAPRVPLRQVGPYFCEGRASVAVLTGLCRPRLTAAYGTGPDSSKHSACLSTRE